MREFSRLGLGAAVMLAMELAACGGLGDDSSPLNETGPDSGSPVGGSDANDPGGGGDAYSWGEAEVGVTVGPFGDLKFFRAGCGQQLWARWIPREDFVLKSQDIHRPNGSTTEIDYFETLGFHERKKTVFLLSDSGGYEPGNYSVDFTAIHENGGTLTHTAAGQASDEIFRQPQLIAYASSRAAGSSGLQTTITPSFDGDIRRIFVYAKDTGCLAYTKVLFSAISLTSGVTTEVDIGASLTPEMDYVILLQGVDDAIDYVYFATLEITAP